MQALDNQTIIIDQFSNRKLWQIIQHDSTSAVLTAKVLKSKAIAELIKRKSYDQEKAFHNPH